LFYEFKEIGMLFWCVVLLIVVEFCTGGPREWPSGRGGGSNGSHSIVGIPRNDTAREQQC